MSETKRCPVCDSADPEEYGRKDIDGIISWCTPSHHGVFHDTPRAEESQIPDPASEPTLSEECAVCGNHCRCICPGGPYVTRAESDARVAEAVKAEAHRIARYDNRMFWGMVEARREAVAEAVREAESKVMREYQDRLGQAWREGSDKVRDVNDWHDNIITTIRDQQHNLAPDDRIGDGAVDTCDVILRAIRGRAQKSQIYDPSEGRTSLMSDPEQPTDNTTCPRCGYVTADPFNCATCLARADDEPDPSERGGNEFKPATEELSLKQENPARVNDLKRPSRDMAESTDWPVGRQIEDL